MKVYDRMTDEEKVVQEHRNGPEYLKRYRALSAGGEVFQINFSVGRGILVDSGPRFRYDYVECKYSSVHGEHARSIWQQHSPRRRARLVP
jgi:hypothetical protein